MLKFSDLNLGEVDSGKILADTQAAGAFLSLGEDVGALPATGYVIPTLTDIEATGVGEGEKKLASGKISTLVMRPNKLQASVVATEETVAAKAPLVSAIWKQFPSAEVKLVDNVILGTTAKPASWSDISTFADIVPVTIGTDADSAVHFDDALATAKDAVVNFIVMTTAMESYLRRQRIANTGARVFEMYSFEGVKYINGIEYKTVVSTVARAVAGDRTRMFVSLAAFPSPITGEEYRVKDSGTWEDIEGTVHNLNDNKIVLFHESMASAGFNPLDFVVMVPAGADSGVATASAKSSK